jgi:hypothetical protein
VGGRLGGILAAALLALPPAALAHGGPTSLAATKAAPAACGGASMTPDVVVIGTFGVADQGSYVLVPFDVPSGTTAVRVRYCYDQPDAPTSSQIKHTIDLGIYDARPSPDAIWGEDEFRGWGGSTHPTVTISPEGFSTTSRGFEPGPITPGQWAAELGVAAVVPPSQGDSDGRVAWRVEVELLEDPALADQPYVPAAYDQTPAKPGPGWYAGDFHVHAEHSSLGDASMRETFDYAFSPTGANLDFITLSDYVTDSAWGEIGRFQADYPGKLVARSAEVITYRGHTNNHGSATYVDYRTGPVYEWQGADKPEQEQLLLRRPARPASAIFDAVHAAGGYTQINHPTIFPSKVPPFAIICRGCSWEYSAAETAYSKVDAIEVATGPAGLQQQPKPGPNPFTPLAIQFWEDALAAGHKIAAVGSSDSHNAGRTPGGVLQAPIGQATTVVFADELSEEGLQRGVEAGHTYVKLFGNDGPDLRLEARPAGSQDPPAIMGDTLHADRADFTARVIGGSPLHQLVVLRDGLPLLTVPVTSADFMLPFPALAPGRYRLQLQRGTAIDALSSPIYLEPPAAGRH